MVGKLRPSMAAAAALLLMSGFAYGQVVDVYSINSPGFPSSDLDTDNDFTRVSEAIANVNDGETIMLHGEFDWSEPNAWADYSVSGGAGYGVIYVDTNWNNVTISGAAGAKVRKDPDPVGETGEYDFLYLGGGAIFNNVTIENLAIENFSQFVVTLYDATFNDVTVQDCTFKGGPYHSNPGAWLFTFLYIDDAGGGTASNITVLNNTFDIVTNAAVVTAPTSYADYTQVRGILLRSTPGGATGYRIEGNTFKASLDPTRPGATAGSVQTTTRVYALWENPQGTRNYNWSYKDNVIDGGVEVGGQTYRTFHTGHLVAAEVPDAPNTSERSGMTYRNCLYAIDPSFRWTGGDPLDVLTLHNATFENCGWDISPMPDDDFVTYLGPSSPGLVAIRNLYQATYGGPGAKTVHFEFPLSINGFTDRDACHEIASDGTLASFFESVAGVGDSVVEAGILAAQVTDPAVVPVYDPKYTGLPWFSDPPFAGEENEVVGYTVIGDAPDLGDPNELMTLGPVIEIPPGTTLEIAPDSIVNGPLTIRTGPTKAGAPGNPGTLAPQAASYGGTILLVQDGANLILENIIIDGDSPTIAGDKNVASCVALDDVAFTGASVTANNVTFRNALGSTVNLNIGNAANVAVDINGSKFENADRAVTTGRNAVLDVDGSHFASVGTAIYTRQGDNTFTRNTFAGANATLFSLSRSTDLVFGGTGAGNLFFDATSMTFNGAVNPTNSIDFTENWHKNMFGADANESNGYIVGNVPVYDGHPFQDGDTILNGEYNYYPAPGTAPSDPGPMVESNIVAQFDRDLDAWPDAWELDNDYYTLFDSDNDSYPDGFEAANGSDPRDNGSVPGVAFDIAADADNNGIADWYEESILTNTGVLPFLGDVLREWSPDTDQADLGSLVGLTDAVRSLQIVNGQFGTQKTQNTGDLNALDVTGNGVSSLSNPLQVLRFQAGVRDVLPALPGTSK